MVQIYQSNCMGIVGMVGDVGMVQIYQSNCMGIVGIGGRVGIIMPECVGIIFKGNTRCIK